MLSFLRCLISALFACFLIACEGPDTSLRVVSWNVEWFPGRQAKASDADSRKHMADAQQALRELDPDVLILQEIRDTAAAEELCSGVPGLTVHVASAFRGSTQNLIIASKLPADSGWFDRWKAGPVNPPRGYSFAALELPGKRFLLTYSLHLKSNGGDLAVNIAQRQESARQLLQHVQEMLGIYSPRGECSVIIAGDFNTSLDDPRFSSEQTLRSLQAAGLHWTFSDVPFASRVTIPAEGPFPDNTFDHIFTGGLGTPRASVKVYDHVSDHRPVIVDFDPAGTQPFSLAPLEKAVTELRPAEAGSFAVVDHAGISASIGKHASVRGRVRNVSAPGNGITFINFDGSPLGKFVAIIRDRDLATVSGARGAAGLKRQLEGRTVEVSGLVTSYRGAPQIEVREVSQITVSPE